MSEADTGSAPREDKLAFGSGIAESRNAMGHHSGLSCDIHKACLPQRFAIPLKGGLEEMEVFCRNAFGVQLIHDDGRESAGPRKVICGHRDDLPAEASEHLGSTNQRKELGLPACAIVFRRFSHYPGFGRVLRARKHLFKDVSLPHIPDWAPEVARLMGNDGYRWAIAMALKANFFGESRSAIIGINDFLTVKICRHFPTSKIFRP